MPTRRGIPLLDNRVFCEQQQGIFVSRRGFLREIVLFVRTGIIFVKIMGIVHYSNSMVTFKITEVCSAINQALGS